MSDPEKARRLLDTASRVLSQPERDLCAIVATGTDGGEAFTELCGRLQHYLK